MNFMKTWWQKFKISNSLNDRRVSPPNEGAAPEQSAETSQFASECPRLEQALKAERPVVKFPETLHTDIMRAVRAHSRVAVRAPRISWPFWRVAAAVTVLVALLVGVRFHPRTSVAPNSGALSSLAMAGSALDLGGDLVRKAPAEMLSPLAQETQSLNNDLTNAGQFLIASLP